MSGDTESGVLLPTYRDKVEIVVEEVFVEEVIGPVHGPVTAYRDTVFIHWPTRDDIPVSEFTTMHSFHWHFPMVWEISISIVPELAPLFQTGQINLSDDGRIVQHSYLKIHCTQYVHEEKNFRTKYQYCSAKAW